MTNQPLTQLVADKAASLAAVRAVATAQPSTRWGQVRITQGQLDAVAMRCREEVGISLRRTDVTAIAELNGAALTVRIEHSLTAAEHQLVQRATGRAFFQHYIKELAKQMFPDFQRHVEQILPCAVTSMSAAVDCEEDCIIFTFGLRFKHQRFL